MPKIQTSKLKQSFQRTSAYSVLLQDIKHRIRAAQYQALRAVNKELVQLYWDIGQIIVKKQGAEGWGKSVVEKLALDLHKEFPGMTGFSVKTFGICGSFISSTPGIQISNHWLEKYPGRIT